MLVLVVRSGFGPVMMGPGPKISQPQVIECALILERLLILTSEQPVAQDPPIFGQLLCQTMASILPV